MRILLIQPPVNPNVIGAGTLYLNEPLALETIAAVVSRHETQILDMRLEPNLVPVLDSFQPQVVGITAYTPDVYTVIKILHQVKDYDPKIVTVVGGRHATIIPHDFHNDAVDIIVVGEGQNTFPVLVDTLENKKENLCEIKGIVLQNGADWFFTGEAEIIKCLDETPIPARDLTKKYRKQYFRASWQPVASIMTSRGCPYRCNFCDVWKREDGKYRTHGEERVVTELSLIEEKYISVSDDNFLQDYQRAEKIYQQIRQRNVKKVYKLIGRTDTIVKHPDIVEKWKEIGLELMVIGFESFRDEELQKLNKHNSVKNNEKAVEILRNNGVEVSAQFIIRPEYEEKDFQELGDYVTKMELHNPVFSVLTPLPGTDLYEQTKNVLLTKNYELFDLAHCVLPTRIPRKKFYECYAELFRQSYYSPKNSLLTNKIIDNIYHSLLEAYTLPETNPYTTYKI